MTAALFVILFFGLAMGLLVVALMRNSTARWDPVWTEVAERFGLEFSRNAFFEGGPAGTLEGKVRGRGVIVRSKTGRNSHTITVNVLGVKTRGFKLDLGREGYVARLEKLLGARELDTGDRRFDRAFYLHTPQPARCVGVLSEPVRAGLLEVRPNWVGVEKGQVQIGFDGVGRWHRRPLGTLAQTLQRAVELALELAESVETCKPTSRRTPAKATRRPLLAKAVGPALGLLFLGAVLVGGQYLEHWQAQRRQATLQSMELRAKAATVSFQVVSMAMERDMAEQHRELRLYYPDSTAQQQVSLEVIRGNVSKLLEWSEDPEVARQAFVKETLERAQRTGVSLKHVEAVLAEVGAK